MYVLYSYTLPQNDIPGDASPVHMSLCPSCAIHAVGGMRGGPLCIQWEACGASPVIHGLRRTGWVSLSVWHPLLGDVQGGEFPPTVLVSDLREDFL